MTRIGESPSEEHRAAIGNSAAARGAAVRRLVEMHPTDFARLHREERLSRGLADKAGTLNALAEENHRLQVRVQELEAIVEIES